MNQRSIAAAALAFLLISGRLASAFDVKLSAPDSLFNLFIDGQAKPAFEVDITNLRNGEVPLSIHCTAVNLLGKPVNWNQTANFGDGAPTHLTLPMDVGPGFYQVTAEVKTATSQAIGTLEIGVIPQAYPGLRKESFFASNSANQLGKGLKFFHAIGFRIQRVHWAPPYPRGFKVPAQPNGALPLDFTKRDAELAENIANDTWILPIGGYSLENALTPLATDLGMHGPPRDDDEFCDTWATILQHYSQFDTIEFWNEPWIFGWTWAADGAAYRKLQKQWCEMALKVHPGLRIIAGNSPMFTQDHIQIDPSCYEHLLSGTSNHPYTASTGAISMRAGDQQRSMDLDAMLAKEMGLPFHYLTEGGTEYQTPDAARDMLQKERDAQADITRSTPDDQKNSETYLAAVRETRRIDALLKAMPNNQDNNANAYKVVQYFLHAALCGCYQANVQWEIGYGPTWTRSNVTFATMTHFIEDRPIVADIWPSNELIWGAVFANPKFVTDAVKALPRAADIGSRWNVPVPDDRASDTTKVAVIWTNTGESNDKLDNDGTLTVDDPGDIRAYDCTGQEIAKTGSALAVPFTEYPVYLTSDQLDVVTLRSKVADARIEHVTPVNFYGLSLMHPASEKQSLVVRIENQLNRQVHGKLSAVPLDAGSGAAPEAVDFTIPPAKLIEVSVPWNGMAEKDSNQYPVQISADTDAGSVSKTQLINSSHFVKRTITVDGSLDDWSGIAPLLLDSDQLSSDIDLSQYLLNPGLDKPNLSGARPRIINRVYTAYDDDNIYLAAAVTEATFKCTAGEPVVKGRAAKKVTLPYKQGEPDGLNHIRSCGDAFIFAFGFRDRDPNHGRQMDDPYAWKGIFYDVDNEYAVNMSTDGPQLTRLFSPDGTRSTPYQTEQVPGVGPVEGAKIVIKRDEDKQLTIYEMSIPRRELSLFDPARGRLRFGFVATNSEQVGAQASLQYSQAAGVFDHWNSEGSYSPSYMQSLPCQTFSGIDR